MLQEHIGNVLENFDETHVGGKMFPASSPPERDDEFQAGQDPGRQRFRKQQWKLDPPYLLCSGLVGFSVCKPAPPVFAFKSAGSDGKVDTGAVVTFRIKHFGAVPGLNTIHASDGQGFSIHNMGIVGDAMQSVHRKRVLRVGREAVFSRQHAGGVLKRGKGHESDIMASSEQSNKHEMR